MNVSSKLCLLIKMISLSMVLISNSVMSEEPRPESIMILLGEQNLTGCEMLGTVRGSSEDLDDNATYAERLMTARNNLRDETSRLGANTVLIKHANNTGRYEVPGIDKTIIFVGYAYSCK